MALTIPAGMAVGAIHMRYGTDPEDMVVTCGFRALAPPLGQEHVNRLIAAWRASILLQQSSSIRLVKASLRVRQEDGGDILFEAPALANDTGNLTFAGIAPNVAMLVRKHTARSGKRGKGRMYVPGITEDRVTVEGLVDPSSLAVINSTLSTWEASLIQADTGPIDGAPIHPVLFHGPETNTVVGPPGAVRTITITTGAAGPLPDDITDFTCDTKVATQRRRLR